MNCCRNLWAILPLVSFLNLAGAAPIIDALPNVSIPAGKSLTIPITATSPNGRPLIYTITSSTNRISVESHPNNPFWKMSVVQVAPTNAPGAFQTPFRGGLVTVTNIGDLTFLLLRDRAPHTVDAIAALTASGFYTSNTIFHRVVTTPFSIIQGGDPNTNGSGGPLIEIDDEFHPRSLYSGVGQLGTANSGPDTVGSQFFITAAPQNSFNLRYTIFGQLLRGFNVLSNVVNTPTSPASRPLADVIISQASLVPNFTDTAITLTATNLPGVSGTIQVIADDGTPGGRSTNTFIATAVSLANNAPTIFVPPGATNLVVPMNGRVTNYITTADLEGNLPFWDFNFLDANSYFAASNSTFNSGTGELILVPNTGYVGPVRLYFDIAPDFFFSTYDHLELTFAVGDTVIAALPTNFIAQPSVSFSNQLLAIFTNGIPNSPVANFTASINWGDNATNSGVIVTNSLGGKEIRGTHAYTHAGTYPIYTTIRSSLGAATTVVTIAYVQPRLTLTRSGADVILRWPAWATDYQLQTHTNLATSTWATTTNLPALVGYETVVTNVAPSSNRFFRLKR